MLGSMEFACAASGAMVVRVLGHTACGAVKGAIDDVVLGNLTGLLGLPVNEAETGLGPQLSCEGPQPFLDRGPQSLC